MRGWRSYFGFCETPVVLQYLTRWVRLRLRAALWRQWHTPARRRAALRGLGVSPPRASKTGGGGGLRLPAALWRQWPTPRRCRAALIALGVSPPLASKTAGSGRGPWYLARSKALSMGLTNAYFSSLGLPSLIEDG